VLQAGEYGFKLILLLLLLLFSEKTDKEPEPVPLSGEENEFTDFTVHSAFLPFFVHWLGVILPCFS